MWTCGGTPFETSVRLYSTAEGEAAIFAQHWPAGANNTALGPAMPHIAQGSMATTAAQEQVLSAFPILQPPVAAGGFYSVVYNQMVGGMADGTQYGAWDAAALKESGGVVGGTMGGPMLFWSDSAQSPYAMIYTPITHAMEMNLQWSSSSTLEAGLLGSITTIPEAYTSETMLFLGSRHSAACAPQACGLNSMMRGWGHNLRVYKGKDTSFPAGGFERDPTLAYLGYYTDNGAFYYYYTAPASDYGAAFEAIKRVEVLERGIPMRYLQLDSYWYYKGKGGGVTNWTARPDAFPKGLADLSDATGWKFVAHNRYWDPATVYAKQNGGKYDFIVEKGKALPLSQEFWDDLMAESKSWGMAVYEQDWLHNEWEGLQSTLSSATLSTQWLRQMGSGADKSGIPIQYCMAYGRHTVASAEIPAVNQIRVSDDYATGVKIGDADADNANLYVGMSSMFAASLGLAPSKDVFWSNSTECYEGHASRYTQASEPYPELQTAVAVLSAGPVGPGDKLGSANKTLLMSTCNADGLLLKPSYPATIADSMVSRRANGGWSQGAEPHLTTGEVNLAYSNVSGTTFVSVIGMDLPADYVLTAKELGFAGDSSLIVWHKSEGAAKAKLLHAQAGGSQAARVTLRKCGKADFQLVHVSEAAVGGVTLLGEEGKVVPHSPMRFTSLMHSEGTASVNVAGVTGEAVSVSFFVGVKGSSSGSGRVVTVSCAFSSSKPMTAAHSLADGPSCI